MQRMLTRKVYLFEFNFFPVKARSPLQGKFIQHACVFFRQGWCSTQRGHT